MKNVRIENELQVGCPGWGGSECRGMILSVAVGSNVSNTTSADEETCLYTSWGTHYAHGETTLYKIILTGLGL